MINVFVFIPPDREDFRKRTFRKSESQAGSQEEKKRGLDSKQLLKIVTEKIPTGSSCETMKKLCVEDYGGHCTDDGEKCCEIDACVVCYAGWSGPTCNIRKGYREMTSLLNFQLLKYA